MSSPPIIVRGVLAACSLAIVMIVPPSTVYAQTVQRSVLLTITRLNPDCYPDTVLGMLEIPSMNSLPTSIRWGQPPLSRDSASSGGGGGNGRQGGGSDQHPADSCSDGIDAARKVRETRIVYPNWRGFTGTVAFQEVNYDSIPDMILYMRGSVMVEGAARDTLRPLVVYGQRGLDTAATLDLSAVAAFQSGPFFASELVFGTDFENEARREVNDRPSWELLRKGVDVRERDTAVRDGRDTVRGQGRENPPTLAIYPNPSGSVASVEAERLPAGEWTVEVIGVNGAVYDRQEVVLHEPGNVLRTLDVHRLANGYYVLQVRNARGVAGTYPIVVKR